MISDKDSIEQSIRAAENVASVIDVEALAEGLFQIGNAQSFISALVPDAVHLEPTNQDIAYYAFALAGEVHELADALGWKVWKDGPEMTQEQQALVADEFADILAFLGLIVYVVAMRCPDVGVTQLAAAYKAKSIKNVERFKGTSGEEGYNGTLD